MLICKEVICKLKKRRQTEKKWNWWVSGKSSKATLFIKRVNLKQGVDIIYFLRRWSSNFIIQKYFKMGARRRKLEVWAAVFPTEDLPEMQSLRLFPYLFVWKCSDTAGLVFQARFPPLLNVTHVAQIPHQHPATCSAHNQPVSRHRQRVHLPKRSTSFKHISVWMFVARKNVSADCNKQRL